MLGPLDSKALINFIEADLAASRVEVLVQGRFRTDIGEWLTSVDARRSGKSTTPVEGETDCQGTGNSLQIWVEADVVFGQGPDDVSPDATIPAPSTIAANARASSLNTGETSQKGNGKGRHRSQFFHKQAKHHVARRWPHTEDGSGYIMVTHSLLCIL